jgi:hypothetical protein
MKTSDRLKKISKKWEPWHKCAATDIDQIIIPIR